MSNHPHRRNYLAIYTREESGQLKRHTINGISKEHHADAYAVGPVTKTEKLVGWPEAGVEWHDNIGYGIRFDK